jgi:hypothetical protein
MSPKLPSSSSPWNIHTHSHAHTHTHTQHTHTHNGHPFSFLLLWWGGVCFLRLLGDPKTVTTRHKSVAAEETGHWIDETGDRPTRQTLDRGRRRRKKGKKRETFFDWASASANPCTSFPPEHNSSIDRVRPCVFLTCRLADLFIHPRLSSTAKVGHTFNSF